MCLAVMYACGLRISEATTLEVGAIDRANHVLRIVGKGNKDRLVPLPQPILDDLGHLWRTHRNRRWLFPNRRGDAPINKRVLSETFAVAAEAAGISRRVTPHTLRHSVRDQADRERRQYSHRADLAGPLQHRLHRHLHPSHHAHSGIAP